MTKLNQQAVALAYESNAVAPRVLAKGTGLIAEVIIAKAKELKIPLTEEPEIISILMQLEVDEFIPPVLYAAIAEILVWVYSLDPTSPVHQTHSGD
jgi:flagellar biosynthesis protein